MSAFVWVISAFYFLLSALSADFSFSAFQFVSFCLGNFSMSACQHVSFCPSRFQLLLGQFQLFRVSVLRHLSPLFHLPSSLSPSLRVVFLSLFCFLLSAFYFECRFQLFSISVCQLLLGQFQLFRVSVLRLLSSLSPP